MKISLNWLKDYVSCGSSAEKIGHKLTMAGLEVEKISSYLNDKILELEITPNRADCLSMTGIARELSAILDKNFDSPKIRKFNFPVKRIDIKIQDKTGCGCYIGTVIEDIKIDEAPLWIRKRLESLGLKSINNVVDVTNFCLMELGQPLHAFDYDKVAGGKIVVRKAKDGEKIVTLDNIERVLDSSILVIADDQKPLAIAGIMGGVDSQVTAQTKNVLLESAYFDPVLIRRTSRKLGITTDSSYRFERRVDYERISIGAHRALALILTCAGGVITKYRKVSTGSYKKKKIKVMVSKNDINSYLGAEISFAQIKKILKRLDFGISVENKETLKVSPPSFRPDIVSKVDIIEEVSRVIGYDKLPLSLPKIQRVNIEPNKQRQRRKETEKALLAQGFSEIITFSMTEQNKLEMSEINATSGIKIKNPLSLDQEVMRSSLLPSTLSVVQTNLNRGEKKLKFYEFGKIYTENKEQDVLSLFLCGETLFDWRSKDRKIAEFYDLKGSVENLYSSLGITNLVFQAKEEPFFEKGQSCFIYQNKTKIGSLGLLKENVLAKWNIKERQCYFAQMDLEVIYRIEKNIKKFQPIIGYPSIVRDVSLAVKQDVSFQDIKNIIYENCGSLLSDVRFTEEYLGDKIEFGYRGLVFSLIYQSEERTLKEEEINDVHEKIVQELIQKLAVIRR